MMTLKVGQLLKKLNNNIHQHFYTKKLVYSLSKKFYTMVMKKVKIRASLKEGWLQFNKRPWYLMGLFLATAVLIMVTSSQNALATALSYIVYGGYLALLLKHYAGKSIQFDDLFDIDKRWVYFAFLGVIKTILIMLGFVCFIIPGIYLAIRWMFAELFVIDKGMRPLEALKASSELTEGYRWKLFLFGIASMLLVFVSLFAFIVGALIASIVVQFAAIRIYKDLQSKK